MASRRLNFVALLLLSRTSLLIGQQAHPPVPPQEQEPGTGAQVHTGIQSGLDTDARLQSLLADHQYFRIEQQLDQLPGDQAQFYRGILANRENDPKKSIQLLEPLVDKVAASDNTADEKILRKALAEDYLRDGQWAKAAKSYELLATRLKSSLSKDDLDEIEMPLKMLPLGAANPPMTVEPCDPFVLPVSKDPLGLTDVPVFVDARPHSWMLDPTAPFNLIARSLAREAGLTVSTSAVTIHTLTGRPMQVHATVIPRFTLGGRLTFRNMTAFVFDDRDYAFAGSGYQVQGVLGYPALAALDSLTVTEDATIDVRPSRLQSPEKPTPSAGGAPLYIDGDQMIVGIGPAGSERMFALDAGGQQSYFTSRYFDEHMAEFNGAKMELFTIPGSQAFPPQPAFVAETLPLDVGGTMARAHYIQVLTQPLGSAAFDDVYGFLGVDVLDQFRSYTFDYRNMRFRVRPE